MPSRRWIVFLTLFLITTLAVAKKKKQVLPDYVLNAHTVAVLIDPDAGEPIGHPTSNRDAQDVVERALTNWGRLQVEMDFQTADLIIVVRKGNSNGTTIHNSPVNDRPLIVQHGDGNIRVGAQQGRPPNPNDPRLDGTQDNSPRVSTDIGSKDDSFAVYFGNRQYPLDTPPIWRYMAKDALNAPNVTAVEEFRKTIEEAEKQRAKP
ncbi:MAG TPA: hypothetical protein VGF44_14585 [Terriglobales bacterium]|jgi:hypothetical protein